MDENLRLFICTVTATDGFFMSNILKYHDQTEALVDAYRCMRNAGHKVRSVKIEPIVE